jgi:predicted transcriptional regulator
MARQTGGEGFVRPTDGELEILRILWQFEAGTVRELHADLAAAGKQTAYSTTQTLLRLMHAKGLVVRDDRWRPYVYRPAVPQEQMQQQLVADLLDRAFGGAAGALAAALMATGLSDDDRGVIGRLLDGRGEA